MTDDSAEAPAAWRWMGLGVRDFVWFAVIGVGVVVYFNNGANKTDLAVMKTDETKQALGRQLEDVKATLEKSISEVKLQITALPDVSARLAQTERRLSAIDQEQIVQNGMLTDLQGRTAKDRADIDNLVRASALPLGVHGR